jgi:hypothetical protein
MGNPTEGGSTMRRSVTRLLTLVCIGALALLGATAAPAMSVELPTDEQELNLFRDQWGITDFQPTLTTEWAPTEGWERVTQWVFAAGDTERDGVPEQVDPLRKHLQLFERSVQGNEEYAVTEEVFNEDGSLNNSNLFPFFEGNPQSFTFYNNTLGAEFQERCRTMVASRRNFLVCRVLIPRRNTHLIGYYVNVVAGEPETGLPTLSQVLNVFQDKWGQVDFQETGYGPWTVQEEWTRVDVFVFDPDGTDEFDGDVIHIPSEELLGLEVKLLSRRTPSGVEHGMIDDTIQLDGTVSRIWFPLFRGNTRSFVFNRNLGRSNEAELTCRPLDLPAQRFKVCRTIFEPDPRVTYQTWIPKSE